MKFTRRVCHKVKHTKRNRVQLMLPVRLFDQMPLQERTRPSKGKLKLPMVFQLTVCK